MGPNNISTEQGFKELAKARCKIIITRFVLVYSMFFCVNANADINGDLRDECKAAVTTLEKYLTYGRNSYGPLMDAKDTKLKMMTDFIDWCVKVKAIRQNDFNG